MTGTKEYSSHLINIHSSRYDCCLDYMLKKVPKLSNIKIRIPKKKDGVDVHASWLADSHDKANDKET